MSRQIILVGARGLAKEIIGFVDAHGGDRIVALLDDGGQETCLGYPVFHPARYRGGCRQAVLAMGLPHDREAVVRLYRDLDLRWVRFTHAYTSVSPHAVVGEGVVMSAFVTVAGRRQGGGVLLHQQLWLGRPRRGGGALQLADAPRAGRRRR